MLGFVFWAPSKRSIEPAVAAEVIRALRAEHPGWEAVGVFVDPEPDEAARTSETAGLDRVQLSGHESRERTARMPRPVIKAVHVRAGDETDAAAAVLQDRYGADRYLLDTHVQGSYGGTGSAFDWAALRAVGDRVLVAGGLTPANVGQAVDLLRPYGVDVSGGVEYPGGGKDPRLIDQFIQAVRVADDAALVRGSHG